MGAFNPLKSNAHILAYVVLELGRVGNSEEMCREMPDSQSVKIAGGGGGCGGVQTNSSFNNSEMEALRL